MDVSALALRGLLAAACLAIPSPLLMAAGGAPVSAQSATAPVARPPTLPDGHTVDLSGLPLRTVAALRTTCRNQWSHGEGAYTRCLEAAFAHKDSIEAMIWRGDDARR